MAWFINRKRPEIASKIEVSEKSIPPKKSKQNLPLQISSFVGREAEIKEIRELLTEHRLITITGSGGCGKTRLACEAVKELANIYEDGVWFVDLSPVTIEDMVIKQIFEVLEIPEQPGQNLLDALINVVSDKKMLIILDNCEHQVNACAQIACKVIQSVPGIRILATSREGMKITGEKIWRIPSLSLSDSSSNSSLETAMASDAVQLYANRAKLVNPQFEIDKTNINQVVEICNRVDGIPLAIEIVASRSQHMDPQLILDRLSDRLNLLPSQDISIPERQKTLYSTIEWGYKLLDEKEQLLFTKLTVFAGSFDLEAAEKVCSDADLTETEIMDLLASLIDKSMIYPLKNPDQARYYNFYESLRQFGLEKLREQNLESAVREQHMIFFLHLTKPAYEGRNISQSNCMRKLDHQHDNLIVALEWALINDQEKFVEMAGYLAWYWVWRNHFLLGKSYLEKALSLSVQNKSSKTMVKAGMGTLSFFSGDPENAFRLLQESIDIYHKLDHLEDEAIALNEYALCISSVGIEEGNYGLSYAEQACEVAEKSGNPATINHCKSSLCQSLLSLKRNDEVIKVAKEMELAAEKYDQPMISRLAHHFQADCYLIEGKFKESEEKYIKALEYANSAGNAFFVGIELVGVAMSVSGQLKYAKAIRLCTAATELSQKAGYIDPAKLLLRFWVEQVNLHINELRKKLPEDQLSRYEEEGRMLDLEEAISYARDTRKE
ncbi:NB-ARC domain-containing protein [Bacteroidota bacterium]